MHRTYCKDRIAVMRQCARYRLTVAYENPHRSVLKGGCCEWKLLACNYWKPVEMDTFDALNFLNLDMFQKMEMMAFEQHCNVVSCVLPDLVRCACAMHQMKRKDE